MIENAMNFSSDKITVDYEVVKRLASAWPKRAGVRTNDFVKWNNDIEYNEHIPDYPNRLLPFHDHPLFLKISSEKRQRILTWAWLIYNERVITAEDKIANPTFAMIINGVFPGINDFCFKQALRQCLIDEHFHSLLHVTAIQETKKLRKIDEILDSPPSMIYQNFLKTQALVSENWEKDLLTLIWTVVAEISVNAYLELLSTDDTIQPMHKTVTSLHNRDEFSHSSIIAEAIKLIYFKMNSKQKSFFIDYLPKAINAFTAHDFSAWTAILSYEGIKNSSEMLHDCQNNTNNKLLLRDFKGIKKFASELDILDKLNYEF